MFGFYASIKKKQQPEMNLKIGTTRQTYTEQKKNKIWKLIAKNMNNGRI